MTRHLLALVTAVAIVGIGTRSIAGENGYVVIVNANNHVGELDRDFIRDMYLKKAIEWGHGETIRPIDLTPVRDQFVREILHKTPAQLKNYWNQQIFSGKGVPPPETDSPAAVISYVVDHPGAIGYLPSGTDPGHARIVRLK